MSSWRVRGGSAEGTIWRGVWCLAETELCSAKTEVCDFKKYWKQSDINKSAKITRRLRNLWNWGASRLHSRESV